MYLSAFEAVPLISKLVANLITSRGWVDLCTQWIVLSFQGSDELHEINACILYKLDMSFDKISRNIYFRFIQHLEIQRLNNFKRKQILFWFSSYHYPWCKIYFKVSSLTQITTMFIWFRCVIVYNLLLISHIQVTVLLKKIMYRRLYRYLFCQKRKTII